MNAKKRSRVAQAARLLSPHLTGRDVLEIACGTADFSLAAAETARSVTAIDLDDCRLSPAARSGGSVCFQRMDAAALSFPGGSFDTAVLYTALGHLTAILPAVLSEADSLVITSGTELSESASLVAAGTGFSFPEHPDIRSIAIADRNAIYFFI